jgi:prepilin-type N-terminal cleavage/methylation domain-containing protein
MISFWAKDESGFSLVELSMALLIMGVIIGGVLKGQDLLESARLKSLTSQVNEYRVALTLFQDRYDALPGDYAQASDYIDASLSNGKGNGFIEGSGLAASGAGHEALSFWAHLAAANLMSSSKISPGKKARFGHGAPKAKIGGGFTVQYNTFKEGYHWFVLGEESGASGQGAGLTPLQAMTIDQKGDSGQPLDGKIRAKDGVNVTAGSCVTAQGAYNAKNKNKACVLYFQF